MFRHDTPSGDKMFCTTGRVTSEMMNKTFVMEILVLISRSGFIFFFQAEDGIRDIGVTGVQTCALPICAVVSAASRDADRFSVFGDFLLTRTTPASASVKGPESFGSMAARIFANFCDETF